MVSDAIQTEPAERWASSRQWRGRLAAEGLNLWHGWTCATRMVVIYPDDATLRGGRTRLRGDLPDMLVNFAEVRIGSDPCEGRSSARSARSGDQLVA